MNIQFKHAGRDEEFLLIGDDCTGFSSDMGFSSSANIAAGYLPSLAVDITLLPTVQDQLILQRWVRLLMVLHFRVDNRFFIIHGDKN